MTQASLLICFSFWMHPLCCRSAEAKRFVVAEVYARVQGSLFECGAIAQKNPLRFWDGGITPLQVDALLEELPSAVQLAKQVAFEASLGRLRVCLYVSLCVR